MSACTQKSTGCSIDSACEFLTLHDGVHQIQILNGGVGIADQTGESTAYLIIIEGAAGRFALAGINIQVGNDFAVAQQISMTGCGSIIQQRNIAAETELCRAEQALIPNRNKVRKGSCCSFLVVGEVDCLIVALVVFRGMSPVDIAVDGNAGYISSHISGNQIQVLQVTSVLYMDNQLAVFILCNRTEQGRDVCLTGTLNFRPDMLLVLMEDCVAGYLGRQSNSLIQTDLAVGIPCSNICYLELCRLHGRIFRSALSVICKGNKAMSLLGAH